MSKIKRSLAIIIGINEYEHIPKLKNAVSDAVGLASVLKDIYGYEVLLLLNQRATKAKLNRLVKALKNKTIPFDNKQIQVSKSDRILFYFAGHGFAEEAQDSEAGKPAGYFMPQDALDNNKSTWLSMQEVYEAFSALNCHHLLMILDCCFAGRISWISQGRNAAPSGKLYRQSYDRFIKHKTEQIITSAAYDEEAQDLSRFGQRGEKNGNSPFAHLLLKVLQGNSHGSRDKFIDAIAEDGVITTQELFAYLQTKLVTIAAGQTPGLSQPRKYDPKTGEYVYLKGEYIFPLLKFNPEHLKKFKLNKNTNPYKGLASFETEDSQLFYGRKALTQQLNKRVPQQPLTIVLGASGTGKSSLVKAGLIPSLKAASNAQSWQILDFMRPGEFPFKALNKILTQSSSGSSIISLQPQEQVKLIFHRIDQLISSKSQSKLLLIIDQSEELLTLCKSKTERLEFLNLLASLSLKYPQKLRLVLTLRSDFEPQIRDAIAETYWQQAWQQGRLFVTSMNREELQQAIEEPAAQRTMFFASPKLVNALIDEAIDTPGALPLLSFTLSELYLKYLQAEENGTRDDRTITQADYEQLGGVARSLTQAADNTYRKLVKEKISSTVIRNLMLRMIALNSGELARRKVPISELVYPEPIDKQVQRVIEGFVAARLLTKGFDVEEREYVEPVHDALVTGWQKLLTWQQQQKANLLLQRRLTPAAEEWASFQHGYGRSRLQSNSAAIIDWLDRRLSTVENLFNRVPARLIPLWYKSQGKEDGRSLQRPQQFLWNSDPYLSVLEREFESNKNWFNQIEAEFVRHSIRQKHQNVSWRWRIAIMIILGLSGLFFTAMIFLGLSKINQAKVLTQSAETSLKDNQSLDGMTDVFEAGRILEDRAIQILLLVRQWLTNADLKAEVRGTLLRAVYTVKEIDRLQEDNGTVRASISPNGRQIISAGEDGTVRILNLDAQGLRKSNTINCKPANCEPVKTARFSPNGHNLAMAGANGTIRVWNMRSEKLIESRSLNTEQGEVKGISFSPDGKQLATTGANGTIRIQNFVDFSQQPETLCLFECAGQSDNVVWSVEFSPDGNRLAATGNDGAIRLWVRRSNQWQEDLRFPQENNLEVTSVEFSPDGTKLVTAGKDGIIRLWEIGNYVSAKKLTEITTEQEQLWDVSFSQNGQKLASAGEDGTVRIWELDSQEPISEELAGHQGPVRSANFLNNDLVLSAGDDGSIRLWNLRGNELEKSLLPLTTATDNRAATYPQNLSEVMIQNEQQRAFGNDNGIVEWQQSSLLPRVKMRGNHVSRVISLAFSPDGEQLASGGQDRTIRLWNNQGEQAKLLPTSAPVNSVAYSSNGHLLASAAKDGSIQLWDLQNLNDNEPFAVWQAYRSVVSKVKFSQGDQVLITIGEDSTTKACKLWSIESFDELMQQAQNRVNGDSEQNFSGDRALCDSIPP